MELSQLKIKTLKHGTAYDYFKCLVDYSKKYNSNEADIVILIITDFLDVKFGVDIYSDDEKKNDRLAALNQLKPQLELLISSMKDLVITQKLERLKKEKRI